MGLGDRIAVHGPRPDPPARPAGRGLRRPGRHLRGHLPRLAADEPGAPRRHAASGSAPSTCCRPSTSERPERRSPCRSRGPDRVPLRRPARVRHGHAASASRPGSSPGCRPRSRPRSRPARRTSSPCDRRPAAVLRRRKRAPGRPRPGRRLRPWTRPPPSAAGVRAGDGGPARHFADRERLAGDLVPAAGGPLRASRSSACRSSWPSPSPSATSRPATRQLRLRRPAQLPARPRRPGVLARAAQHVRLHRRLDGPDRGARQDPGQHPGGRLPRQVAGPVPGPAALDDPGGAVGASPGCGCSTRLQPDRLGAAPGRAPRVAGQRVLARPAAPGHGLGDRRPRVAARSRWPRSSSWPAWSPSPATSTRRPRSTAPASGGAVRDHRSR